MCSSDLEEYQVARSYILYREERAKKRGQAQARIREAEGYKLEVVANAEGEVDRFNKLLEEYKKAPIVTRDRLYLDALQSVLSNSTKVMVDVEGGNNLLYLPLDKIMEENKKKGDDDE